MLTAVFRPCAWWAWVDLHRLRRPTSPSPGSAPTCAEARGALILAEANWWSWSGSNRRPPECKSGALPAELQPLLPDLAGRTAYLLVGLGRLESPTAADLTITCKCSGLRRRTGCALVGLGRLELPTSPLSGVRSNHLSYRPRKINRGQLDAAAHDQHERLKKRKLFKWRNRKE